MANEKAAWNRFCDAMDALRSEQERLKRRNEEMRRETAEAIRKIREAYNARQA